MLASWKGWHAPLPRCHGGPQASCRRLSRFSQIIVGSSLWIADPHWPDFSFQPQSPFFFEHILQSPLQKADSDDDNHICRKAQLDTSQPGEGGWTFRGELTSIILILGFLSLAPIIRLFGHLPCLACLKSGHLITPAPASASAQRVCLAPEKAQISSAPLFCLSTYLCISYIRMRCCFTPFWNKLCLF